MYQLISLLLLYFPFLTSASLQYLNSTSTTGRFFKIEVVEYPWFPDAPLNIVGHKVTTGLPVTADKGTFWVNASSSTASPVVAWVDHLGHAYLADGGPGLPIYLNTQTGALQHAVGDQPFAVGALTNGFAHFGESPTAWVPSKDRHAAEKGPGQFAGPNYQPDANSGWTLCPRGERGYQVMRFVGGKEDWSKCLDNIFLSAIDLDYKGL